MNWGDLPQKTFQFTTEHSLRKQGSAIVEAADTLNIAPDDYINPDDGLKYCGKCHTPKEAYFPEQYRKNGLDQAPDCLQMRR